MKNVVVLAVAMACGEPKAPAPPAPKDALAIYTAVAQRYASAKTYTDQGDVTIVATAGGKSESDHFTFSTQFIRAKALKLAIEVEPGKTVQLWSNQDHTYIDAFFNEDIVDYGVDPVSALHALGGITGGLSTGVPLTLLDRATRANAVVLVPSSELWDLRVTDRGDQLDLFIDRETSLIRRTVRISQLAATTARPVAVQLHTTITYNSTVDGPVPSIKPIALDRAVVPDGPPAWLGIMSDTTAVVLQVIPSSPANLAGIKAGDQVVSIDGHPVTSNKEIVANAHKLRAEQHAVVVVKRDGASVPIDVVPKPRPDAQELQAKFVGAMAPPFALPSVDGKSTIDVKALHGNVVVVDFWATWCKPCAITTPHLDGLAKKFPALRVVGISDEDQPDIAAYLAKHPVSYAQAVDAGDKVSRDYLIQGLPTIYVIDKAGVVQFTAVGVPDFDTLDDTIRKLL